LKTKNDAVIRSATSPASGFALVGVMVALILVSVLAAVAIRLSTSDRQATWSQREGEVALFAAEAGANQVWANWPPKADSLAPGDSLSLGWTNLPSGQGYHAVIRRVDDGTGQEVRVLRVEGRGGGRLGGQRVVELWATRGGGIFKGGVGAKKKLLVQNDVLVDSYDSGKGAYGGPNVGDAGDVHSNGEIEVKNASTVAGKATAKDNAGGTETGAEPREYSTLACPVGGYTPASSLPAGPGYEYDESKGNLKVDDKIIVELPSGTYFFHDVMVEKVGSELRPAPGATVTIYLDHKFHLRNEAKVNQGGKPADLAFVACGSDPSDWVMENNSEAATVLYNPDKKVTVKNDSRLFGAMIGEEAVVDKGGTGPTAVHFDEALLDYPLGMGRRQIPRAWAQIAR
jgi:hypothetical protein